MRSATRSMRLENSIATFIRLPESTKPRPRRATARRLWIAHFAMAASPVPGTWNSMIASRAGSRFAARILSTSAGPVATTRGLSIPARAFSRS